MEGTTGIPGPGGGGEGKGCLLALNGSGRIGGDSVPNGEPVRICPDVKEVVLSPLCCDGVGGFSATLVFLFNGLNFLTDVDPVHGEAEGGIQCGRLSLELCVAQKLSVFGDSEMETDRAGFQRMRQTDRGGQDGRFFRVGKSRYQWKNSDEEQDRKEVGFDHAC